MGAFIKLNKQNAFISPHTAHKQFHFDSSSFEENGIEIYYGERTPDFSILYENELSGEEAYVNGLHKHLVYSSIKHLYFANYSGSIVSGSFENYAQNTVVYESRSLGERVGVLSIPTQIFGSAIQPESFRLETTGSIVIVDDGEGKLKDSASRLDVGEIIYPHGLIIVTHEDYVPIIYNEGSDVDYYRLVYNSTATEMVGQILAYSESIATNVINTPVTSSATYYFSNVNSQGSDWVFDPVKGNFLRLEFQHEFFKQNNATNSNNGPYTGSGFTYSKYWQSNKGAGPFIVDKNSAFDRNAFETWLQTYVSPSTSVNSIENIIYTVNVKNPTYPGYSQFLIITASLGNNFFNEDTIGGFANKDYFSSGSGVGWGTTTGSFYSELSQSSVVVFDITASIEYTAISQSTQYTHSYSADSTVQLVGGQTWPIEIVNGQANPIIVVYQDGAFVGLYDLDTGSMSIGGTTATIKNGGSPAFIGPYTSSNPAEYTASYNIKSNGTTLTCTTGYGASTWPSADLIVGTYITVDGKTSRITARNSNTIISIDPPIILDISEILPASGSYYLEGSSSYTSASFRNSHEILTHQYHCMVSPYQLNYSLNPSSYSNSPTSGSLLDNITGSYFQPYITTIGLYNDSNELIAVGKLARPTPKSQFNDMTFVVKIDM